MYASDLVEFIKGRCRLADISLLACSIQKKITGKGTDNAQFDLLNLNGKQTLAQMNDTQSLFLINSVLFLRFQSQRTGH